MSARVAPEARSAPGRDRQSATTKTEDREPGVDSPLQRLADRSTRVHDILRMQSLADRSPRSQVQAFAEQGSSVGEPAAEAKATALVAPKHAIRHGETI